VTNGAFGEFALASMIYARVSPVDDFVLSTTKMRNIVSLSSLFS